MNGLRIPSLPEFEPTPQPAASAPSLSSPPPAVSIAPPSPEPATPILDTTAAADGGAAAAPGMLALAAHISSAFEVAFRHRNMTDPNGSSVTDRMISCLRRRRGQYPPADEQEIARRREPKIFMNMTDPKCADAQAWITDVVNPLASMPFFGCDPTPIPDLSPALSAQVISGVTQEFKAQVDQILQQATMQGVPVPGAPPIPPAAPDGSGGLTPQPADAGANVIDLHPDLVEQIRERTDEMYQDAMAAELKAATERAEDMADKIRDQLTEANFTAQWNTFVWNLCTYPTAFMEILVKTVKRGTWAGDHYQVIDEAIPTVEAFSSMDSYPGPNATSAADSYFCRLMSMERETLSRQRGAPGWNTAEIDAVLTQGDAGAVARMVLPGESERAALESRDIMEQTSVSPTTLTAVKFFGSASGKDLQEWGAEGVGKDLNAYHEITGILIGSHVVYAVVNADPLGRRPILACSWRPIAGSVWGQAIPEQIEDIQDTDNSIIRCVIKNSRWASGPLSAVNMRAAWEGFDYQNLEPGDVVPYDGAKVANTINPVLFTNVTLTANQMLPLHQTLLAMADDRTGIPRYVHGDTQASGAGRTASGLAQLIGQAGKGIKQVLSYLDQQVIMPLVEWLATWNLIYLDDEKFGYLKGDVRVSPRGALQLLTREQTQLRRQDFYDRLVRDPRAERIIPDEGWRQMLETMAEGLQLQDVIPTDDEFKQIQAQRVQQAQMQQIQAAALAGATAPNGTTPGAGPGAGQGPAMEPGAPGPPPEMMREAAA